MSSSKFVIVASDKGPVKGVKKATVFGRNYVSFRGIPYMKAPVGKLRFRDAELPEKWTEPLDATGKTPSYFGLSFLTMKIEGQEDAGTVSVLTPSLDEKLPVAVYIHGGGFQMPYGTFDLFGPDYLFQKDFVLVTINYRVGPIGFLSLQDPSLKIPGNAGLKDQVLALKWVQKNIEKFGGDPKNVTIFGTSAGGASCHFLMMTEKTKGLFHRAIPMSGTSFIKTWPFALKKDLTERLAKALGWDGTGGERKILELLENADAKTLVLEETKLLTKEEQFNEHILFPFTPVIEPYETENSFLTKDPVLVGQDIWSNDIDCIFGVTSLEGGLMAMYPAYANYYETFKNFIDSFPLQEFGPTTIDTQKLSTYAAKLHKLYMNGETPSEENRHQYVLFAGDIHFGYGIYRAVMSRVKSRGKGKTYYYRFDAQGSLNYGKILFKLDFKGACHGDDMGYLFRADYPKEMPAPVLEIASKEFGIIKTMTGLATSFIITGDPNNLNLETEWKPVSTAYPVQCLNITADGSEMITLPEKDRFKVWNEILEDAKVPLY